MSVHFIAGKPRGGKSYSALRDYVIPELVHGKRKIITNLALDLPELAQYLHDNHGDTFNLRDRVRILTSDETPEFWLFKDQGEPISARVSIKMPTGKRLDFPDFSCRQGDGGILYLIDECHVYYAARRWQLVGDDALYYMSQHGKLGDTVVAISQALGNVDKAFKSVGQDFTYVRNHGKESLPIFGGFFRGFSGFEKRVYGHEFNGTNQLCMETRIFKLNLGMAKCYKTEAGVGIVGGAGADKNEKHKGAHPLVLLCLVVGVLWGGWAGIGKAARWFFGSVAKPATAKAVPSPAPTNAVPVISSNVVASIASDGRGKVLPPSVGMEASTNKVWLRGVTLLNGIGHAWLSDGRHVTTGNGLQQMARDYAIVEGQRYVFEPYR